MCLSMTTLTARPYHAMPSGTKAEQLAPPSAADSTPDFGVGMSRSMRAMAVYNEIKTSYEALNSRTKNGTAPDEASLRAIHEWAAGKCLELARVNGGIYNKAAQFAASLQGGAGDRGVPEEYIKALRVCTDRAPSKPFSVIDQVLIEEFGMSGRQLFQHIDEEPIAAASIAQVRPVTYALCD